MKYYEICFSPTGGTKKAADILIKELNSPYTSVDLTDCTCDFRNLSLTEEDVAVIAVPSFGGRMPKPAVSRLAQIKGNGAKAVLMCVYGNRAFEDTLAELEDTAKKAGFHVIAAVSAIAQHSIISRFAAGRPDIRDQKQLTAFAGQIHSKIFSGSLQEPEIPGKRPYRKRTKTGMVPMPSGNCTKCGLCAEKCPVRAIDRENPRKTDRNLCISCMRCVSLCPSGARKANGILIMAAGIMLKKSCSRRKECRLYL